MKKGSEGKHRWEFFRAGGVDQVVLRDGADIVHLDELDQKLWVALACPTKGLEMDARTLDLIDTDHDGRVRVPEILATIRWIREVYRNPDDLVKGGDSVPLSAIHDGTDTGKALAAGARRILSNLGKEKATAISLADVMDTTRIFAETRFNGDGIIVPESAEDPAVRSAIEDVLKTQENRTDRSGKAGVDQPAVEKFFVEATALVEWHTRTQQDRATLPLGDRTGEAADAVQRVRAKVEDYFTRCRLAAFDARAAPHLNCAETEYAALAPRELSMTMEEVARLPLAHVEPERALPLGEAANPAWTGALADLASKAVAPLLGKKLDALTLADWNALTQKLALFESWRAAKPATTVEGLGIERLRALAGGTARKALGELIEKDRATEQENAQIESLERLVRLQRDFYLLLRNFVNFSSFYNRAGSLFQAGTLYLDGRSCDLCVRVDDAARHATLAGLARTYLAYCDCMRSSGERMTIAACFTGGDSDNLMVGRNGVFYDRKGRDWDATITKIIDNPISIRQSFFRPYKTLVRLIEEQVAKRAATADASSGQRLEAGATQVASADKMPPPKKVDIGTVAAIAVAVSGITTFLTAVLGYFLGLGAWIPLGFLGIVLAISGPAMLIAWLKLRQRNLGPILDASGWAVNSLVKINVPFGGALTSLPVRPPDSVRTLKDPYAQKRSPWPWIVLVLLVLAGVGTAWYLGKLDRLLPEAVKSTHVLGDAAPGSVPAAEPATPPPGN